LEIKRINDTVSAFKEQAERSHNVSEIRLNYIKDPFKISCECILHGIGRIKVTPFTENHINRFQRFFSGRHPEWGLNKESKMHFEEHPNDTETLQTVVKRVTDRMDARHLIMVDGHVVGYLIIEEINCIQSGKPTFWNETYYAMMGIGVSDRFHGKGLSDFGVLFLKLVAAVANVGLGLVVSSENERALKFYTRHGFVQSGFKKVLVPHTGKETLDPWMILSRNELLR
jgi:ribosomal protein S18 acetylase RimI-like enzyme